MRLTRGVVLLHSHVLDAWQKVLAAAETLPTLNLWTLLPFYSSRRHTSTVTQWQSEQQHVEHQNTLPVLLSCCGECMFTPAVASLSLYIDFIGCSTGGFLHFWQKMSVKCLHMQLKWLNYISTYMFFSCPYHILIEPRQWQLQCKVSHLCNVADMM